MAETLVTIPAEPDIIQVDWGKSAIVVVDMQNAFVSPGGMFDLRGFDVAPNQRIIPKIDAILQTARSKGVRIFYICHVLSKDLREVGPSSSFWYKSVRMFRENPQWADRFLIRDTWGAEVVEALEPHETDIIVEKPRFSAFFGTNFDLLLHTYSIKHLFFTGCATNICVEAAIRDAANLDYHPVLVSDATINNGPPFMQDATIFNVKLCFGWVAAMEDVLKGLESFSGQPR
jgi:ureidoacrylate peracid hydrolase